MLFNSFEFIFLFLPITLIGYFVLNSFEKEKLAKGYLVLASLFFYGYFNYSYLLLIIASILFNYFIGDLLVSKHHAVNKKIFLIIGVIFNISLLGYFKYFNFFVSNVNLIFNTNLKLLNIILPLGISFFTFQQLSFIIDSYKGSNLKYDFLSYCLFVTFFPQLIAGPIVLPNEMLPQFENHKNKKISYDNLNKGLYIFSIGLAKKVLIADFLSEISKVGFDQIYYKLNLLEAWLVSISYTLQLYFDFSGYCDMAVGIALMFNIVLPLNFNSPYKATNIQDFWKRWHMTLGRFLTTYLYIPLGGNRKSELNTLLNLLIVFLVSGIWHGAGWNFLIWGALHGLSILVHRFWKHSKFKIPKLIGWFITFNLVNIFWIFFRSSNIATSLNILESMFNINKFYLPSRLSNVNILKKIGLDFGDFNFSLLTFLQNYLVLIFLIFILISRKNSFEKLSLYKSSNIKIVFISFLVVFSLISLNSNSEFLYFNF
ncbi:MAG: MBOAT family O-acyltransferase [Cetobacterium sp.]